jgi:c-di-GMP-binding flagellar brake protein YcgR
MFIKGRLREDERKSFIKVVRYAVSVLSSQQIEMGRQCAVSVDISNGGMGIITDFPLEQGQSLTFEDEIPINTLISKRAAVVKWTGKMNNKYRAGLKFV